MSSDIVNDITNLLNKVVPVFDLDKTTNRIRELETIAADPTLWEDQDKAQEVTSELATLKSESDKMRKLIKRVDDLKVMQELAAQATVEEQAELAAEIQTEETQILEELKTVEIKTMLSGEYDSRPAVVTIRSGAGGEDAADWADMLFRMYTRWADRNNHPVSIYDTSYADGGGIKSATFLVNSPYAYGLLSIETGIHRLVRISPFDSQARRHTSFAEVEVLPLVETTDKISIPDSELRIDVYRSSGPGGQSVNTTDSAVRITHIPTGIVVTCQNEKSQLQNKASAMKVLQSRLLEKKRREEKEKLNSLKGNSQNSWGGQMRSYVLQPYQMVKDLRTEYSVGNPQAVLDGDIDDFIATGIKWRIDNNITS